MSSKTLLIVGGKGRMGQLFSTAFTERGHKVFIADRGDELSAEVLRAANVVLVSVAMQEAKDVIRAIAPRIEENALLCDINSLKTEICSIYRADCRGESLGLHPMFGPTVQNFSGQKIILCPVRQGPLASWLRRELAAMGFSLLESSAEGHDRIMAVVQVLIHFGKIVTAEALRRSGFSVAETTPFMSPIYQLELSVIGRLFAQDPALYAEIEMENPWSAEVRQHFANAALELNKVVDSNNRELFCKEFTQLKEYFADSSEEAMRLSDLIINSVMVKT